MVTRIPPIMLLQVMLHLPVCLPYEYEYYSIARNSISTSVRVARLAIQYAVH